MLRPNSLYPELVVGALIFNPKGQILLMKSRKWRNQYVIPGGHLDLGEKIEQALKREIKEETSLDIYRLKFLNFREAVFDKHCWSNRHLIFFNYIAKTGSLDVRLNSEAQEYRWVSLEEALELPLVTYTRKTIEDYKAN